MIGDNLTRQQERDAASRAEWSSAHPEPVHGDGCARMPPKERVEVKHRLSADQYHAATDWLSNSMFKLFLEDPRLYEAAYITKTLPHKRSTAMDLGTVAHAAILEPHIIDGVCLEIPASALNGDGHRKGSQWKDFAEQNAGRILIKPEEMKLVRGMFEACYANSKARRLLMAPGATEASIFWTCTLSGVRRRVRPDKIVDGWGWVNLKTSSNGVDEDSFRRTVRNFGYDVGQEFYLDAADALYGSRVPHVFILVEQDPPHRVRLYELSEQWAERAGAIVDDGLRDFATRQASGDWSNECENVIQTLGV